MCEIVPYTPELLPQLYEIEKASFSDPWSMTSLADTAARPDSIFFAAMTDGVPCGFGCVLTVAEEGELVDIAVSPAQRNNGIGQRLMTALLDAATQNGCQRMYLEVRQSNVPAQRLYEKNGFLTMGIRKRYYKEPVEDAIVMVRERPNDTPLCVGISSI